MRLPKEMIKVIADAVARSLEEKRLVQYSQPRLVVAEKIAETVTSDLMAEDKLDEEVKKILAAHENEISKGGMDYRKVFEMTKQKLARERGIAL